jgi:hypothetical protein
MGRFVYKDSFKFGLKTIKDGEEIKVLRDLGSHITFRYESMSVSTGKVAFLSEAEVVEMEPEKVKEISLNEEFICEGKRYKFGSKFGILVLQKCNN